MNFQSVKIIDVKVKIGELVKVLRKRDKLTQDELASLLDLSRLTIQNLELGKNPTMDTVLKVMQHFGLLETFNDFIDTQINNNKPLDSLY